MLRFMMAKLFSPFGEDLFAVPTSLLTPEAPETKAR
jgi:hypothetical protein